ncbi:kinesin-like protein KIF15, partial [Argopecten irradians]|uniref:kinesin-like protein KIF15 n=1 Tax=Argopecten irradians TaxID=31199 RepID=UPI00371B6E04
SEGATETTGSDGDAIKVFVRIRPSDQMDSGNPQSVDVDQSGRAIIVHTKPQDKVFTFDEVLNIHAQQEALFSAVAKSLIESCVSGYNGTIFAYGQTGSGKTFTMLGPSEDADNFQHKKRGIIPRSFEYLFNLITREKELHGNGKEFLTKCTFLEIYHEHVYDLLDPSTMSLSLRESMKKGVYVEGLAEKSVTSASEAYQVLNDGWINRRVASTSMNRESSRSHAVFTIFIESKEKKSGVQKLKESQLNLVDLAGSERQRDSKAAGLRLKEAGSINKSLSVLGKCIMALVDRPSRSSDKGKHIPYRESKLTFLLRDSLGGNAKTSIIACVHPDSRHFGETLSTLQFARQAKMIKNKAIVNEDTQGNLMSLQAEIRRLKEENQKLMTARGDTALSNLQPQCPKGQESGPSVWKERFVNAMMLREKCDGEKLPLSEKIQKLEELCNKKDKMLQSTKMIIKFRESHISRLEKTIKSKEGWEDAEERLTDLKAEISNLKYRLEHNPVVTKYDLEIQHLKSELHQYRASGLNLEAALGSQQRMAELEQLYFDLMAKQSNADSEEMSVGTPTRTSIAVDTLSIIEKNKSLEAQLKTLKQTLTEQKEAAEKREMELESEVTSQKKTITELTNVLEAQQLKSKLERDVHFQTVQTITTPKKIKYNLRSQGHMNCSTSLTPSLDKSIESEDMDDLFAETEPPLMLQITNEALRSEVEQLQSSINNMTERIDEYEADSIKLKQQISKIDHQNAQLTEILQRERMERATTGEKSDSELMELQKKLQEAERCMTYFKEEAEDLKVVLDSSDKELKDLKSKKTEDEGSFETTIATLQTQLMQVEMEMSKMTKEYSSVCEERDILLLEMETAQDTVMYNECLVRDLEKQVQEGKEKLEDTQSQLKTVTNNLATEKYNHDQLVSKTQLEGAAQEQENLRLVQEKELLQSEAELAQNKIEQQDKTIQNLKGSTNAAQQIISNLQKQQEQNKEAVAGYMSRIEELRTALSQETSKQIDQTQQCQSLSTKLEEQASDLKTMEQVNRELQAKLEARVSCHNAEMSMMKEDMDCVTEANDKIQEEYANTQVELESLQKKCETLEEAVKAKTCQLEEKEALHKKKVAELEDQIKEALNHSKEQEWLMEELDTLKTTNSRLNEIIEEYEVGRKEKNEEIKILTGKVAETDGMQTELEKYITKKKEMEYQMECERISHEEKVKEITQVAEAYRLELKTARDALQSQDKFRTAAESANTQLQRRIDSMTEECKTATDNSRSLEKEVDRLIALGKKYTNENEDLKEENERLMNDRYMFCEEIEGLKAKIDEISKENTKLQGHQNHKQKIHYHMMLKEENAALREQLKNAQRNIQEFSLGKKNTPAKWERKENVPPMSYTEMNCEQIRKKKAGMFLSGDFS